MQSFTSNSLTLVLALYDEDPTIVPMQKIHQLYDSFKREASSLNEMLLSGYFTPSDYASEFNDMKGLITDVEGLTDGISHCKERLRPQIIRDNSIDDAMEDIMQDITEDEDNLSLFNNLDELHTENLFQKKHSEMQKNIIQNFVYQVLSESNATIEDDIVKFTLASWILFEAGDVTTAEDFIRRAIFLNETNSLLHFFLGRIVDDPQEKLNAYTKSITICPERSLAYNNRGNIYKTEFMDTERALRDYSKAIQLDDTYGFALINRGNLYKNVLKQPELALQDYTRTIQISSGKDAAVAYFSRANLYKHSFNDKEQALKDYNKSIELDPTDSDVFNNRGNLYRDYFMDYNTAIEDYTKSIELNPKNGNAYYNRAYVYLVHLKQYDFAKKDYLASMLCNPEDSDVYFYLGWMYDCTYHDPNKALEYYTLAIEKGKDQNVADYYHNRAVLYHNVLNDPAKALQDYTKAISYSPNDPIIYCNRGVCYEDKLGEYVLALQDYLRSIELSRDYVQAQINIGMVLERINTQNVLGNM